MPTSSEASPGTAYLHDVQTWHCICTQMILASTHPLSTLPIRSTLDSSFILQLPSPEHPYGSDAQHHYATLLGTTLDRDPIIVRGAEGFEKRWLQRCSRCHLTIGYQLDRSQYEGAHEQGRRDDVVYLLPGGLQSTSDMAVGSKVPSVAIAEKGG